MKLKNKILLSFTTVLLILSSIVALELFSTVQLPKQNLPFNVGTRSFQWEDSSRYDSVTQSGRYLNIEAWYPTDSTGPGSIYHPAPDILTQSLSELYGLPEFLINRLATAATNFIVEAPLSSEKSAYPVLIFSHGMNGTRFQNSQQMEYLAGHGYIIFSIEHTHTAIGTILPGNRIGGSIKFLSLRNEDFAENMATRWSDDQLFVLAKLDYLKVNSDDPLFASLDLERLGLFGHSFGGLSSIKTLTRTDRFITGINMDGYLFGRGHNQPFTEPYLEFRSPWPNPETATKEQLDEFQMTRSEMKELLTQWEIRVRKFAPHGFTRIHMHGSNHMTFSDFMLMMPFPSITAPNYTEQNKATSQFLKAWFDHHIMDMNKEIILTPGRYGFAEVTDH